MERLLPPAFDVIIKSKLCTKDSVHKYENNCNLSLSMKEDRLLLNVNKIEFSQSKRFLYHSF